VPGRSERWGVWGGHLGPPISVENSSIRRFTSGAFSYADQWPAWQSGATSSMADGLAISPIRSLAGGRQNRRPRPEQADATPESSEVAKERPAGADLAAVEAGATDTGGLDVHGLLGDARRVAQHVDEQGLWRRSRGTASRRRRLLVAADRPLAEAARREARGRDEAQVRHTRPRRTARFAAMAPPNEKRRSAAAPRQGTSRRRARCTEVEITAGRSSRGERARNHRTRDDRARAP